VSKTHRSVSQRARDHQSAKSSGAQDDAYETDDERYPGHAENTSIDMLEDADSFDADTVAEYFALQFRKLFDENLAQYVDTPAADESKSSGSEPDSESDQTS